MVSIAGATASATIKMVLMCTVIARLVRQRILPPTTAATLSRVTFIIITPCMLFTRLASTLGSGTSDGLLLFTLPCAMALQVALGHALGLAATSLARQGRGWHPARNPTSAASAIAASTAKAVGAPLATKALQGTSSDGHQQLNTDRLTITASAFGNSLTLPLVFLTTLFHADAHALDAAIARTALVQIAWYPLLWSVGYKGLVGSARERDRSATLSAAMANRVGARVPPSGMAVQQQLRVYGARAWGVVSTWLNPPLVGVAAGVAVGGSGAVARLLGFGNCGNAPGAALPIEMEVVAAAARCVVDVVGILGSAALACQAIVLGASLANDDDAEDANNTKQSTIVIVSLVRFLFLPALTLLVVMYVRWAAPWCLDPMAAFVLCVQAVMPPAQSLAVMAQLGDCGAAATSQLLLRVYGVAVVPVALWVAVFLRVLL